MKAVAGALLLMLAATPALAAQDVRIESDRWTAGDERGYGEFIPPSASLGAAPLMPA